MTAVVSCPVCGADAEQTFVDIPDYPGDDARVPGVIICPNARAHAPGQVVGDHPERLTDG